MNPVLYQVVPTDWYVSFGTGTSSYEAEGVVLNSVILLCPSHSVVALCVRVCFWHPTQRKVVYVHNNLLRQNDGTTSFLYYYSIP